MADKTLRFLLLGEDKTASKAIKGVGTEATKTQGKLKGFATGAGKMGAAIKGGIIGMAITAVAGEVIDFGKASVDAFQDAEKSQRLLTDAYKRFPAVQDVSIAKMREYNTEIQKKTGADADDLAASQAVLARYKLTGSELRNLTPLLVDYATRTGKELPAAAGTLGKAMMGNGRAMKELGINFKDTGDPAKNLKQIMAGLSSSVGGYATTVAGTAEGKTKILTTRFGDLQEQIGQKLMPVMEGLLDMGMGLMDWLDRNPKVLAGASAAWDLLVMAFQGLAEVARVLLLPTLIMTGKALSWLLEGAAGLAESLGNRDLAKSLREMKGGVDSMTRALKDLSKVKPKPTVDVNDLAKPKIKALNEQIRGLRGKIVDAKAKGAKESSSEVKALRAQIAALRSKKVEVKATVKLVKGASSMWAVIGKSFDWADGGIMRSYADGGMENHTAQIARAGEWRIWAEDETGGEAYIPLARSKRARSLAIWRETGRLLGAFDKPSMMADGGVRGRQIGGVSGGGGGNVYITVSGDTDPDAAARRIEDLLYRRRNRAGRLKFQ